MTSQFDQCGPENMIIMSRDRMAFGGPQVASELVLGGYVIYVSIDEPFLLTINRIRTKRAFLAIVPPYAKHSVIGPRSLRSILIESETVSPDLMLDGRLVRGGCEARAWAMRIEDSFQRWQTSANDEDASSFDLFFFGERLPYRKLDKRIAIAAGRIRTAPDSRNSQTFALAKDAALSPSRLRHMFSEQIGAPIRSFRAWKRLRNAIQISHQNSNILQLAMAAGYADATHLCHAVRLYFGEQPSFVCSHWRRATFIRADTREYDAFIPRTRQLEPPAPARHA
jgi:AraC-like DNA-binding protein